MKDHEPIDSSMARTEPGRFGRQRRAPRFALPYAPISLIDGDCPPAPEPSFWRQLSMAQAVTRPSSYVRVLGVDTERP